MEVNVHFRVTEGASSELEAKLQQLGFEKIRVMGSNRVVLWATEKDLVDRLGLVIERKQREKVEGILTTQIAQPIVTNTNRLPPDVAELVLSCYAPVVPNRLRRS